MTATPTPSPEAMEAARAALPAAAYETPARESCPATITVFSDDLVEQVALALDSFAAQAVERERSSRALDEITAESERLGLYGAGNPATEIARKIVNSPPPRQGMIAAELAAAEARGRERGLEEAAQVADVRLTSPFNGYDAAAKEIAVAIRALSHRSET